MDVPEGPLSGIRVVDLTINVLGPMATQMLGDMGAEVVKVETTAGDPMRTLGPRRNPGMAAHFVNFNRSKRSLTLNLKRPEALEALMRLAAIADVFVHNMRTGAAERLGIGPDAVRARSPWIVYAHRTGYAKDGPKRDRPAFDDVIQGESGLAGMIGRANGEPRFVPYAIADKLCGVYLASAVSAALFHRERTGRGQTVHVPMFETMVSFNLVDHMWETTFSGRPEDAGYPRMFTPHRRPYPTRDGHICLMAVNDDQWRRLYKALDRHDLADDPRFAGMEGRIGHIDTLYGIIGETMLTRTTAEWQARLDEADVPNARMNDLAAVIADPYLAETGFFRRYQHPTDGPHTAMAFPIDFSESPAGMRRPAPPLGDANRAILSELGYDDAEIAGLTGG
ncbi:MAG: CaiB/BaiF CoA transferase family protein [Alphaproteobacteria bacterium]